VSTPFTVTVIPAFAVDPTQFKRLALDMDVAGSLPGVERDDDDDDGLEDQISTTQSVVIAPVSTTPPTAVPTTPTANTGTSVTTTTAASTSITSTATATSTSTITSTTTTALCNGQGDPTQCTSDYAGKCNDDFIGAVVEEKCPVMCDSCPVTTTSTTTISTTTNTLVPIDDCADGALFNFAEPIMQKKRTVASRVMVDGLDAEGCATLCNTYGEVCLTFVHRGDTVKCKLYTDDGALTDTIDESMGYYVRVADCRSVATITATVATTTTVSTTTTTVSATTTITTSALEVLNFPLYISQTTVANKAFWEAACVLIPGNAAYVTVKMGGTLDYFRPASTQQTNAAACGCSVLNNGALETDAVLCVKGGTCIKPNSVDGKCPSDHNKCVAGEIKSTVTFCEMLVSNSKHEWSRDGTVWVNPGVTSEPAHMGGSVFNWPYNGDEDNRTEVAFWGDASGNRTGGCCSYSYASPTKSDGWEKEFTMKWTPGRKRRESTLLLVGDHHHSSRSRESGAQIHRTNTAVAISKKSALTNRWRRQGDSSKETSTHQTNAAVCGCSGLRNGAQDTDAVLCVHKDNTLCTNPNNSDGKCPGDHTKCVAGANKSNDATTTTIATTVTSSTPPAVPAFQAPAAPAPAPAPAPDESASTVADTDLTTEPTCACTHYQQGATASDVTLCMKSEGTVRVFSTGIYTRGCHWFPCLLASSSYMRVTNSIPLGSPLSYWLTLKIMSQH
jgi:hypothetical protein